MRLFVDNCIASKHVESLAPLFAPDPEIVHLRAKFAENAPDEEWLTKLHDEREWIVVSGDTQIIRNARSLQVWKSCGLTTFFLASGWMHLGLVEQHVKLTRAVDKIIPIARRAKVGAAYKVKLNGDCELLNLT